MKSAYVVILVLFFNLLCHQSKADENINDVDISSTEFWQLKKMFPDAKIKPCSEVKEISFDECIDRKLLVSYGTWKLNSIASRISLYRTSGLHSLREKFLRAIKSNNKIVDKILDWETNEDVAKDFNTFLDFDEREIEFCFENKCKYIFSFENHTYEEVIYIWNKLIYLYKCQQLNPEVRFNKSFLRNTSECEAIGGLLAFDLFKGCSGDGFTKEIYNIDRKLTKGCR